MEAKSPSKINLFLNIVGKREDGYHLLESLFAPIGLCDKISITQSDDVSCSVSNVVIADNIALKAANLLKDNHAVSKGCAIHIEKNIPMGGGLGGGSSNAATTLKLLSKFWDLNLSNDELRDYAIKLGADVPFFIDPKPSFVSGIGENITPIKLGLELPILIVTPPIHSVTADVFKQGFHSFSNSIDDTKIADEIFQGRNDTFDNACKLEPEIANTINWLDSMKNVRCVRMSGTGSTCFGIFESMSDVEHAKSQLPSDWVHHSELLAL